MCNILAFSVKVRTDTRAQTRREDANKRRARLILAQSSKTCGYDWEGGQTLVSRLCFVFLYCMSASCPLSHLCCGESLPTCPLIRSWQRVQVIQAAPEVGHRWKNMSVSLFTVICAAPAPPPGSYSGSLLRKKARF